MEVKIVKIAKKRQKTVVLGAGKKRCSILNALVWGRKTIELYSMDKKEVVGTIWEGVPCLQRLCERVNRLHCEKRRKTTKNGLFAIAGFWSNIAL